MSLEAIAAEARAEFGAEAAAGAAREGEHILAGDPAAGGAAGPTAESEAKAWAALPYIAGRILSPVLPELAQVYSEAACMDWGHAMQPVAKKYGWSLSGFELEAALIASTWGLVVPTWKAMRRKRSQNAQTEKADTPPETPAAATPGDAGGDPQETGAAAETHPDGSPKA